MRYYCKRVIQLHTETICNPHSPADKIKYHPETDQKRFKHKISSNIVS